MVKKTIGNILDLYHNSVWSLDFTLFLECDECTLGVLCLISYISDDDKDMILVLVITLEHDISMIYCKTADFPCLH